MKKLLSLILAVFGISCIPLIANQDARVQTEEKLQVSGIFAIKNQLTQGLAGFKTFDKIRITEWSEEPYDTLSYYDINKIKYLSLCARHVDNMFAIVEAKYNYQEALKFGKLYSQKELKKLKENWKQLEIADSLRMEEENELRLKVDNKEGIDIVAYLIYPFTLCANSISKSEEECNENGYSYVNIESNKVDTFLVLGVDLNLYATTQDYIKFLTGLPLVNK